MSAVARGGKRRSSARSAGPAAARGGRPPRPRTARTRREAELEARLAEAEDTLRAIRGGDVDAIVVYGPLGERIFTLRGAEHSYRVLVEAMSEGAATLTAAGTVLYCNHAFAGMVGRTVEQVMGTALATHVAPASQLAVEELLRRARGGGARGEVTLRSTCGGAVPILLSASEMKVEAEELVCLVATHLSEVGRLQDALRGRDEFLSIASHELKTPLTALLLHMDGLLRAGAREGEETVPPLIRDRLTAVRRQVRRIAHLVNDLLDVSRIRSGQLDLRLEEVDLAAVVREVVERARREALAAGCELELCADAALLGRWDRSRLDQVATNLVSNALKYGKGRPVRVVVAEEGGRARLVVSDGGIGIAAADQERIFHRFERAAAGPEYGGMGLGLWITREIVTRLGGTIAVESRLGEGSRFVVELPLAEAQASSPAA